MKISHFPDFLPDETVYSVCCRYLDRMQFRSSAIVSQHFFGSNARTFATDLPSALEHLIQALPPHHMYTADTIIDHHTLFPLYATFLLPARAIELRRQMKTPTLPFLNGIAGISTSSISPVRGLRYCPACVSCDRLSYGECYWHCAHQFPGVLVCPIHEVMLELIQTASLMERGVASFRSAESVTNDLSQQRTPEPLYATLRQLAINVQWLLEHPFFIEHENIQQQYRNVFKQRGLSTFKDRLKYQEVREAVVEYYPASFLEEIGCGLDRRGNWLENWRTMQHPLHHLLVIQLLCGTLENFAAQPSAPSTPLPFGHGPWPCLNPLCPHYQKRVITSCTIKRGHSDRPVGTFSCRCGFAYTRTGPTQDDHALFRGHVSQFGHLWHETLTTYWFDQSLSIRQIARLMHSQNAIICRQAARLNLPFAPELPARGERPAIYQDVLEEKCRSYRHFLEEELKTHQHMKISDVPSNVYEWMLRNDRQWLTEHFPTSSSKAERLRAGKAQLKHNTYSQMDADWAHCVRRTAEEVCLSSDFPVRVTRRLLIAKLNEPILRNKANAVFQSLPLTSRALDDVIDTQMTFVWRKLRWTVQRYLAEQELPCMIDFLHRARISSASTLSSEIHHMVQIAYNSLREGMSLGMQVPAFAKVAGTEAQRIDSQGHTKSVSPGSLAEKCIDKAFLKSGVPIKSKLYDVTSILLFTVAAIVNGANSPYTLAKWGHQNRDLLPLFGLFQDHPPTHSTLLQMYAKFHVDIFETILEAWLHETFPLIQEKTIEMDANAEKTKIPGLRLLQPYQHIASDVIAKLT